MSGCSWRDLARLAGERRAEAVTAIMSSRTLESTDETKSSRHRVPPMAGCLIASRPDSAPLYAMARQPAIRDVTVNGVRLHYLEWSAPAKPAILILTGTGGLGGTAQQWQDFVDRVGQGTRAGALPSGTSRSTGQIRLFGRDDDWEHPIPDGVTIDPGMGSLASGRAAGELGADENRSAAEWHCTA